MIYTDRNAHALRDEISPADRFLHDPSYDRHPPKDLVGDRPEFQRRLDCHWARVLLTAWRIAYIATLVFGPVSNRLATLPLGPQRPNSA